MGRSRNQPSLNRWIARPGVTYGGLKVPGHKYGNPMVSMNNTLVAVTGSNRGIGFEICRQLTSRGAQVFFDCTQA